MKDYSTISRRLLTQFAVVTVLAFGGVQAFAVTLLLDNRSVVTFGDVDYVDLEPEIAFQDWTDSPNQSSFVSSSSFSGNGVGEGEDDALYVVTESRFDITFSVASATLIDLQGTLLGIDGFFGLGEAYVRLSDENSSGPLLFNFVSDGNGTTLPFAFSGVLEAGTYRLLLNTTIFPSTVGTRAEWSFTADFTPVPVPAMGWLVAVLLAGLVKRGRSS